jgi:hypothetical protein
VPIPSASDLCLKLRKSYDALEDVKSLHELFVNRLQYTCKDIFPFNHTQLAASYKEIINKSIGIQPNDYFAAAV